MSKPINNKLDIMYPNNREFCTVLFFVLPMIFVALFVALLDSADNNNAKSTYKPGAIIYVYETKKIGMIDSVKDTEDYYLFFVAGRGYRYDEFTSVK